MRQVRHNFRAVLSYSKLYDLFQRIMGAEKGHEILRARYIRAIDGDRVLDIGCGTAEVRRFLPAVNYYGFDPNPRYIKSAQNRFENIPNCTFICASLDEASIASLPQFDIVLALGVLHHLNDETAVRLAHVAKSALKKGGRLVLVDPCFVEDQSPLARWIIKLDRGQHVRGVNTYREIMNSAFRIVNAEIRHDLIHFPYTHSIMECVAE